MELKTGLIKAILFDFDGVIAQTLPSHIAAWKQVLSDLDIFPDENTVRIHEGLTTVEIARAIFAANGRTIDEDTARIYSEQKNLIFQKQNSATVYSAVHELLPSLKRRFKLGLVSGSTLKNILSVVPDNLSRLFDVIITDGDTKRAKPNPEPYLAAAKRLRVKPQECIVVENAPLGIQAAKKARTFCIGLMTTLPASALEGADVLCKDHEELLQKIASITAR